MSRSYGRHFEQPRAPGCGTQGPGRADHRRRLARGATGPSRGPRASTWTG